MTNCYSDEDMFNEILLHISEYFPEINQKITVHTSGRKVMWSPEIFMPRQKQVFIPNDPKHKNVTYIQFSDNFLNVPKSFYESFARHLTSGKINMQKRIKTKKSLILKTMIQTVMALMLNIMKQQLI